jgi:hypothetical protein
MDPSYIEQLLNENESAYLDFKREQYHFEGSDDFEKSELLKDILAFSNAWRRTDAYILIGVEEFRGGRSKVIGVDFHLDDHSLQQFVNSKTQKPITFEYIALEFEGVQLGVLRIPLQIRPIYLTKDFGKLKKNVVYIRRGSSTDEASPDEIAKMGTTSIEALDESSLDLQFANISLREPLSRSLKVFCKTIELPEGQQIPIFEPRSQFPHLSIELGHPNKNFYKELVQYYQDRLLLKAAGFSVTNHGQVTASNVRLVITDEKDPMMRIITRSDLTQRPRKYHNFLSSPALDSLESMSTVFERNFDVEYHGTKWTLEAEFGSIQPKARIWSNGELFIGAHERSTKELQALLYADNLPNPIVIPLHLEFELEAVSVDIAYLENLLEEEYKQILSEIDDDY